MKKLVLVVNDRCPNCKYILKQLEKLKLLDKIEVITEKQFYWKYRNKVIYAVPELLVVDENDEIIDQTIIPGNTYGVVKILTYILKYVET